MRTPESSRHAPEGRTSRAPQARRPSARPFVGISAGSLGEDILLARHGDQILRLRQDQRTGQTVATLRGGTTDAAPNRIEGGVLEPRPGESALRAWDTLTHNGDPEMRREVRFLGRLSLIWIAVSLLLGALMAWGMATVMDPAAAEQLMSAYFGTLPVDETGSRTP